MEDIEKRIVDLEDELHKTKTMLFDLAKRCDIQRLNVRWPIGKSPGAAGKECSVRGLEEANIESWREKKAKGK